MEKFRFRWMEKEESIEEMIKRMKEEAEERRERQWAIATRLFFLLLFFGIIGLILWARFFN